MTTTTTVPVCDKIAWSFREVSLMLGISEATIHRHVARGKFPKPRLRGGRRLFVADEIRAWLAQSDEPEKD